MGFSSYKRGDSASSCKIYLHLSPLPPHTSIPFEIYPVSQYPVTVNDLKNKIHQNFPLRCSYVDPAEIAIYCAQRDLKEDSIDSKFVIVPEGHPLDPWRSVVEIIKERFSDEVYGWKELVEEDVEDPEGEEGRNEEEASLGESTLMRMPKRPVSSFLGPWGMSSLNLSTKPKGKSEKQSVSMAGNIMSSIRVGAEGNTAEKEAEEREKRQFERIWERTKEKTIFIAVLPEKKSGSSQRRRAVAEDSE